MYKVWKRIINGNLVKDIIDNFDPYGVKEKIDIELNKQYDEEIKLNQKEK